jgi:hypothetical protein
MQQPAAARPRIESESGTAYQRPVRILVAGLMVGVFALATILWRETRPSAPIISAPMFVSGHPSSVTIAAYDSAPPFGRARPPTPSRVVRVHDPHWVTKLVTDLNSLPGLSRVPRCPADNGAQHTLTFGYADGNRWRLRMSSCTISGGGRSWPGIIPSTLQKDLNHLLGQAQPV